MEKCALQYAFIYFDKNRDGTYGAVIEKIFWLPPTSDLGTWKWLLLVIADVSNCQYSSKFQPTDQHTFSSSLKDSTRKYLENR